MRTDVIAQTGEGQRYVAIKRAFVENRFWYFIYFPSSNAPVDSSNNGPSGGWVEDVVTLDPSATQIQALTGLLVLSAPGDSNTALGRIYTGERFVTFGMPTPGSGCTKSWYKTYLPGNKVDQKPTFTNTSEGWVCGDPLTVTQWSTTRTDATPTGGRRFQGRFGKETVGLMLNNLPPHNSVTVSFDLFIIQSWDGNATDYGPDIWELNVGSGPTLLRTTFSNHSSRRQAYPDWYPGGDHPGLSAATETDTLGYPIVGGSIVGDSVYRLNFTFSHSASSLTFNFHGSPTQDIPDESWGLDKVVVTIGSGDATIISEQEPNDTPQQAQVLSAPVTVNGQASPRDTTGRWYFDYNNNGQFDQGVDDLIEDFYRIDYRIDLTQSTTVSITLSAPNRSAADLDLYITDCQYRVLGRSAQAGTPPEIVSVSLAPGTYYIIVTNYDPGPTIPTSYTLSISR